MPSSSARRSSALARCFFEAWAAKSAIAEVARERRSSSGATLSEPAVAKHLSTVISLLVTRKLHAQEPTFGICDLKPNRQCGQRIITATAGAFGGFAAFPARDMQLALGHDRTPEGWIAADIAGGVSPAGDLSPCSEPWNEAGVRRTRRPRTRRGPLEQPVRHPAHAR